MNLPVVILIGAVLGAFDGIAIFLTQGAIQVANSLRGDTEGMLVALLTGFSIAAVTQWWLAKAIGALYGQRLRESD